jgi:hypothetical protein
VSAAISRTSSGQDGLGVDLDMEKLAGPEVLDESRLARKARLVV